jgi:hypothetical protein
VCVFFCDSFSLMWNIILPSSSLVQLLTFFFLLLFSSLWSLSLSFSFVYSMKRREKKKRGMHTDVKVKKKKKKSCWQWNEIKTSYFTVEQLISSSLPWIAIGDGCALFPSLSFFFFYIKIIVLTGLYQRENWKMKVWL